MSSSKLLTAVDVDVEEVVWVWCVRSGGVAEARCGPELVLEGVVVAGALSGDERSAAALLRAGAADALVALLRLRQADDDHVLQTVFAFRQLLSHPRTADYLVSRTGNTYIPYYRVLLTRF